MVLYSFVMGWLKPITDNHSNDHDNTTSNSASDSFSESSFLPTVYMIMVVVTHPNVTTMES